MTTTTTLTPAGVKAKGAPNRVLLVLLGVVVLAALFKLVLAPVLFGGGDGGATVVRNDKAGKTVSSTNPGAPASTAPKAAAGTDTGGDGAAAADGTATGDAEVQGTGGAEDVATGGRDPFSAPSSVDLAPGGSSSSSSSSG